MSNGTYLLYMLSKCDPGMYETSKASDKAISSPQVTDVQI